MQTLLWLLTMILLYFFYNFIWDLKGLPYFSRFILPVNIHFLNMLLWCFLMLTKACSKISFGLIYLILFQCIIRYTNTLNLFLCVRDVCLIIIDYVLNFIALSDNKKTTDRHKSRWKKCSSAIKSNLKNDIYKHPR